MRSLTQRVSQIDCAPPRAQTIAGGTVQTLPTGYGATLNGDVLTVTIGTGITAGSEPDAGAFASIPLRDILGGLIGPLDGGRILAGYLYLEVLEPRTDGSGVVVFAIVSGSADTTDGHYGAGIRYAATRVLTALRESSSGTATSSNSTVITGHDCTIQGITLGAGNIGTIVVTEGPPSAPTGVDKALSGHSNIIQSASYLHLGAYSDTVPGAPIVVQMRVRAVYLPAEVL